jgi:hypothetical protein
MGFNLDNYEPVKDRIERFYADHPDGSISTELVTSPSDLGKCAGFKAFACIGTGIRATGYAYEEKGQGVNRDAWVENAETSAIGRALANFGYCGTLRPSREEMSKVGNTPDETPSENFVLLKSALIDYINAGAFEHPENVELVIGRKDIVNMRKALEAAKAREAAKEAK